MEQEQNHKKPIENVAFSWSDDNRFLGIAYMFSLIGLVFLRKPGSIGVRMLKLDMIAVNIAVMSVISAIANAYSGIPFIGKQLDFWAWNKFILLFGIIAVIQLVIAQIKAHRKTGFPYTRGLGEPHHYELVCRFLRKVRLGFFATPLRYRAFVEPLYVFLAAHLVSWYLSFNLGFFLVLVSASMVIVGLVQINNHNTLRWDLHDQAVLGNVVKSEKSDEHHNETANIARLPESSSNIYGADKQQISLPFKSTDHAQ